MIKLASFDVFDTLVCRLVAEPTDVFRVMEAEHPDRFPTGFAAMRIESEVEARRRSSGEDISLSDIYQVLADRCNWTDSVMESLMVCEMTTEVRLCVPRHDVLETYRQFRNDGVRVVAISDMYLPETVIQAILDRCGIAVDELYVSSEVGVTKASGRLYEHVRQAEGVKPEEWVHHGDNFRADIENAIAAGLKAKHFPIAQFGLTETTGRPKSLCESIVTGTVRHILYGHRDRDLSSRVWRETGAAYTGLFAMQLCDFARRKAEQTGAEGIYFLARDGYVLKKVYDVMFPGEERQSVYLAASRRMINFIKTDKSDHNLGFIGANAKGLTGHELLGRINVSGDAGDPDLGKVLGSDDDAMPILDRYMDRIVERAALERTNVLAYLKDAGLLSDRPSVLVDVGWFCSIQKSLQRLLAQENHTGQLHGVYFGTNVAGGSELNAEGLLYTNHQPVQRSRAVGRHIEIMELLFTAPEQSIVTVEPNAEGGFSIVRTESDHEEARMRAAAEIVAGALDFATVVRGANLQALLLGDSAVEVAVTRFDRLVSKPGRDIVASIMAINHSVGFGGSRYEPFLKRGLSLRRPLQLLRAFIQSYWREALYRDLDWKERLLVSGPVLVAAHVQWHARRVLPKSVRVGVKSKLKRVLSLG